MDRNGLDSPQDLLDHSTLPMRPFLTPLYFVVIFQSINLTLYIMQFPWSVSVFLAHTLKDLNKYNSWPKNFQTHSPPFLAFQVLIYRQFH